MKVELKKFNMKNLEPNSVIVLLGKRATGKSYLIRDILTYIKTVPVGVVISGTERANHFYESVIPKMFIYDDYKDEVIRKLLDRQEKITNQYKTEVKKYGRSDIDPRAFLILDDCLFDTSWTKDKSMRYVFMNGRHLLLNHVIISMQYPLGCGPAMRTNIDYVFILRENYLSNRRRIYDNYAGMFPTFEFFNSVMDACTENYEMLVIANNMKSNKLEDQVFWYKAEPHADFKVCCNEFWDMQHLEDERRQMGIVDDDDEEYYDPNAPRAKGRMPPIRVKKTST